jgi:hypothetical protein
MLPKTVRQMVVNRERLERRPLRGTAQKQWLIDELWNPRAKSSRLQPTQELRFTNPRILSIHAVETTYTALERQRSTRTVLTTLREHVGDYLSCR